MKDIRGEAITIANEAIKYLSDYIRAVCYEDLTYIKSNIPDAQERLNELLRLERILERCVANSCYCPHYIPENNNPYPLCDNLKCQLNKTCCISAYMDEKAMLDEV